MANVNLIRSAEFNYTLYQGNSLVLGPVAFEVGPEEGPLVPEDFTGCTFKLVILSGNKIIKELTDQDGISVNANAIQYIFPDLLEDVPFGDYTYYVDKTDASSIDVTIQHGTITWKQKK